MSRTIQAVSGHLEPQILIWLMVAAAVFSGLMLVAAATFFPKVTAGLQS